MSTRAFLVLAAIVILLGIGKSSLYIVNETERAVLLRFGEVVKPDVEPGLHFKAPFMDSVAIFDGRLQTLDARPQDYLTLEKKRLIVDSYLKWRISNVKKYYTATSGDAARAGDLLSSRVDTGLRNQFGQRTLNEAVSGEREQLMLDLKNNLSDIAKEELGIEVYDIRVKRIDLPQEVSQSVYERMRAEREREARELRSKGKELAEGIRADADRQKTVLLAQAYRESETIRGEGDALASSTYANAFNQDPEFYSFYRSLSAYKSAFSNKGDIMVVEPDSDFFKYLKNPTGQN